MPAGEGFLEPLGVDLPAGVKLYNIPAHPNRVFAQRGPRDPVCAIIHSNTHLYYSKTSADVGVIDNIETDPNDETRPHPPWSCHFWIDKDGHIYQNVLINQQAVSVELAEHKQRRNNVLVGGRMRLEDINALDDFDETETDSEDNLVVPPANYDPHALRIGRLDGSDGYTELAVGDINWGAVSNAAHLQVLVNRVQTVLRTGLRAVIDHDNPVNAQLLSDMTYTRMRYVAAQPGERDAYYNPDGPNGDYSGTALDDRVGRMVIDWGFRDVPLLSGQVRDIVSHYKFASSRLTNALHIADGNTGVHRADGQFSTAQSFKDTGELYLANKNWFNLPRDISLNAVSVNIGIDYTEAELRSTRLPGEKMWTSLVALLNALHDAGYIREIHRDYIFGHSDVYSPYDDPGPFPWEALFNAMVDQKQALADRNIDAGVTPPDDVHEGDAQELFFGRTDRGLFLKQRKVFFEAGIESDESTFQVTGDDLRIKFEIDQSTLGEPGPSTIQIWNLSLATRELLRSNQSFRLYAGYASDSGVLPLIARGQILSVRNEWKPPDWITSFLVQGTDAAQVNVTLNKSYQGESWKSILAGVADAMDLSLADVSHLDNINDIARPFTARGDPQEIIKQIGLRSNFQTSISAGFLNVDYKADRVYSVEELNSNPFVQEQVVAQRQQKARSIAYYIRAATGLIKSPSTTKDGVEVEIRLTGGIAPLNLVSLESKNVSGSYIVQSVNQQGDTWSGKFRTKIKAIPYLGPTV